MYPLLFGINFNRKKKEKKVKYTFSFWIIFIKEAQHIRLTNLELINRDEAVTIPECWQPVLDHAVMMSSTHTTPRRETDDGTIDTT